MRVRVVVLRPDPGAGATRDRAAAAGMAAIVAPLFTVRAVPWHAPAGACDAVMATSANALRLGGAGLAALRHLPLYAVGAATGRAAADAGFADVRAGSGDVAARVRTAAADGVQDMLHLAGREHRRADHAGLRIGTAIVYAADAVTRLPEAVSAALTAGAIALLHSPRAAALFGALIDDAGFARAGVGIAAISPAALAAAGGGWGAMAAASLPIDTALLAAARDLCEERRHGAGRQSGDDDGR